MRKCCDKHQMCYHSCNADKISCDDKFQTCLIKQCGMMEMADKNQIKGNKTNLRSTSVDAMLEYDD